MSLEAEALQAFPKVSLHDHLDGGLRPQTIIELATDIGQVVPADHADAHAPQIAPSMHAA